MRLFIALTGEIEPEMLECQELGRVATERDKVEEEEVGGAKFQ